MKLFSKIINDQLVIKTLSQITINKNGMCTYNPTEKMVLDNGWVVYEKYVPVLTEPELLQQAKNIKLQNIEDYDQSTQVNICYIRYIDHMYNYWANKTERSILKSAIQDCINMGRDKYRLDLRELGLSMEVPCQSVLDMLSALEVYAIDCYNKTTDHIYAVKSLDKLEDVTNYNYKEGYPEPLIFDL